MDGQGGSPVESRVIIFVDKIRGRRRLRGSRRGRWRPGDRHAVFYICRTSGIRAAFLPAVLRIRDAYVPRLTRRPVRAAYVGLVCA